jgi:hypothetical protein
VTISLLDSDPENFSLQIDFLFADDYSHQEEKKMLCREMTGAAKNEN